MVPNEPHQQNELSYGSPSYIDWGRGLPDCFDPEGPWAHDANRGL